VLTGGTGPSIGMILSVAAVIVLTALWVRVAGRRG
jgi:FlaG/FlaF family flagellin (archaellin)